MADKKARFFPFHAINEFMTPEYRQEVLQVVLDVAGGGQFRLSRHGSRFPVLTA